MGSFRGGRSTYALAWLPHFSAIIARNPQTTAFTDPDTGITFQRVSSPCCASRIALLPLDLTDAKTTQSSSAHEPASALVSPNPSADFIGQISCPISNENGYAGVEMTDDMEGPSLIAAWPDGNGGVVSKFRVSQDEDESPPTVAGNFKLLEIPEGTFSDRNNMEVYLSPSTPLQRQRSMRQNSRH